MAGIIGLAILLVFAAIILQVAAKYFKIPDIVVTLVMLLFGFWFVYNLLAFFHMVPAQYAVIR